MNENEEIEFKETYTDNIYKEIVSFLNTKSGVIVVGYDDKGNLKGLDNPEELEEKISNGLKTNISPDARMYVSINVEEKGDKKFLSIKISKEIELNPKSWTVFTRQLTGNENGILPDSFLLICF